MQRKMAHMQFSRKLHCLTQMESDLVKFNQD